MLEQFSLVLFLLDWPEFRVCLEFRNNKGSTLKEILKEKIESFAEGSKIYTLCQQALTKLNTVEGTS